MTDLPTSPPAAPSTAIHFQTELWALWRLAWPILVGQLATVGMGAIDVLMAGNASAQDLAGVSLGASIWGMVVVTVMGVMMSVNPIVAYHVGAKELDQVAHVVRQSLWKALITGAIAFVAMQLAAFLFDVMDIEPAVRAIAKSFVRVTAFALPAFTCYRALYGYSTSINQTKPLMVIALGALLLNALVNWLLVYGNAGFPRLGGVGCAWSTTLCVWFNLLALGVWLRYSRAYRSTWPFTHWEKPNWHKVGSLFKLGLPIGVTYFAESSAFCLIALLIAKFGSAQVAGHQIALNFTSVTFMVPLSLGLALLTRVGQSLGAQEPERARYQSWLGVVLALVFASVCAAGMALFREPIAHAYTNDPAVISTAASLLLLAAVFQFSDCTQVMVSCAMRGYKVTRPPMVLHLVAFWGVSLPLGCLLGLAPSHIPSYLPFVPQQALGATGFWIALIVALTIAALGLVVMLRSITAQRVRNHRLTVLDAEREHSRA